MVQINSSNYEKKTSKRTLQALQNRRDAPIYIELYLLLCRVFYIMSIKFCS